MNIDAAIAWVEDHIDYSTWAARSGRAGSVELSLDRMRRFIETLGNPQDKLSVIHVSGTNGKGSTSKMITRLLMAEGLTVGTYSSPHLARYNERFRIDDTDIPDDELATILTRVDAAEDSVADRLMPFEVLTAAAFSWFAERAVDVAVIEVGVLGRFDATNVADGKVAVITNIGFDHTTGEGDWRFRIASEKAGIVKPGAHAILGPIEDRLAPLFTDAEPAWLWRFGREIATTDDVPTPTGRQVMVTTPLQSELVAIPLHGAHQSVNAALAIAAASAFLGRAINPVALRGGLEAVRMPARMERIGLATGATVILDGAHNPDAAAALARALRDDLPRTGRRTLIIGLLTGRDPESMLRAIDAHTFDRVVAATPPTARARPAAELHRIATELGCRSSAIDDVTEALETVLSDAMAGDQIVVTGSIYLVADARTWLTTHS
ncbi:MAG: Mur ligase family protein [Ilumatobacteraceae bacterium]